MLTHRHVAGSEPGIHPTRRTLVILVSLAQVTVTDCRVFQKNPLDI
jgi:hypothetical protein